MSNVQHTARVLSNINIFLDVIERQIRSHELTAEQGEMYKSCIKEIGKDGNFAENCAAYRPHSDISSRAFSKMLNEQKIPNVPVFSEATGETLVFVPKAYEQKADVLLDRYNTRGPKSEIGLSEFLRNNSDKQIMTIANITPEQLFLIRDATAGRNYQYAVQRAAGNTYKLYCAGEDARYVRGAATFAIAATHGTNGDKTIERINHIEHAAIEARKNSKNPNTVTYVTDARKYDEHTPSTYLRIDAKGLYSIDARGERMLASRDNAHFDAIVRQKIHRMDAPIVKAIAKEEKEHKREEFFSIYTKSEILKAKETLARNDALNGRVSEAEMLCAQCLALGTSGTSLDSTKEHLFTDSVRASEVITNMFSEVGHNASTQELAERYANLNMSPVENEAVLSYLQEQYSILDDNTEYIEPSDDVESEERDDRDIDREYSEMGYSEDFKDDITRTDYQLSSGDMDFAEDGDR